MSKIFITSVDKLEQIEPFYCGKDVSEIMVFHKEKETVSAKLTKALCCACMDGLKVHMYAYSAKEEFMFRLGMLLKKDEEYIISDGLFTIPEWLMSEYKITVDGVNKSSRRNTGKRGSKKGIQSGGEVSKPVVISDSVAEKPFLLIQESTSDDIQAVKVADAEDVVSIEPSVSKVTQSYSRFKKSAPVAPSDVDTNVGIVTTDDMKDESVHTTDSSIQDGYGFTDDVIRKFLQRSGLRAEDMTVYSGTDMDLGNTVLCVLKQDADKVRITDEIHQLFVPADADIVMNWIGSNLKNLHKIAQ